MSDDNSFAPFVRNLTAYGCSFRFLIADKVADDWYREGHQEFIERAWCRDHIRQGTVVVDGGAHHGFMSLLFAKWVGDLGKVYAYEILPDNVRIIDRNAELNALHNIEARPLGLSDRNGPGEIFTQSGNAVASTAGRPADRKVVLSRLDDSFGRTNRVDFLKLDVEGSEMAALHGAQETIKRWRPAIDLELHPFLYVNREATTAAIFELLGANWSIGVSDNHGPIIEMGNNPDIPKIAAMLNPHVYLVPR